MKLKIPYGLSNFKKVISEGYTYVDKTAYIPRLEEQGNYLLLLRPRRFGKSLFISMLEYYYDQRYAGEFQALFGQLAIGQQPTALQNSYQVLFIEFSGIATTSAEDIYRAFTTKIQLALERFLEDYAYPRTAIQQVQQCELPHEKMEAFFTQVRDNKLLVLIDEYDHFANTILADNLTHFQSIVGKGGFVRSFYETLKAATQRGALDRLFITGVTPVMLDSLTSGFNVVKNISLHASFNEAIGFTHQETQGLLQALVEPCALDANQLLADVAHWYDGYWFNVDATESMFNSDMLLYFIDQFRRGTCRYPKQMLDENIASDYGKIMALFHIGNREANYQVLDELIQHGQVEAQQQRKFDLEKGLERDDFVSLLAYMGFVSLQGETLTGQIFGIPNQVIRELYFQYFKVELEQRNQIKFSRRPLELAIQALALKGELAPLASEVQTALQLLSNRDSLKMDEQHLKTLMLTLLYQFPVYFIQSEREMNRKYPDILLLERSPYAVKYQHLLELKYSKKSTGGQGFKLKLQEGREQVRQYLQLPEIAKLQQLQAWVVVSDGETVQVESVQAA